MDAMILRDRDTDANGTLDERLCVQQDANWNVTALVNGSGAVVERYAYDPFGAATVYDASYAVRGGGSNYGWVHQHQGLRRDVLSGLDDGRMRWYSSTLGRWISLDPIKFGAGDNDFYRYSANTPINATDPSGTEFIFGDRWDKPADGTKLPAFQCAATDQNTLIRTLTDSIGDRLEIFCQGNFYGVLTLAADKKNPIAFGKCIPAAGINVWSAEYAGTGKDQKFAKLRWYNIGVNTMKTYRDSVVTAAQKTQDNQKRGSTSDEDDKAILEELDSVRANMTKVVGFLKKGEDGEAYDTVKYAWPEKKVYRLVFVKKAGDCAYKLEWREDAKVPLGEIPKLIIKKDP